MSEQIEQDTGHQVALVVAVALEQWTPPRDAERPAMDYPPHRLLYDARANEMRVEWQSVASGGDWRACENPNHLPLFEGAFARLHREAAAAGQTTGRERENG